MQLCKLAPAFRRARAQSIFQLAQDAEYRFYIIAYYAPFGSVQVAPVGPAAPLAGKLLARATLRCPKVCSVALVFTPAGKLDTVQMFGIDKALVLCYITITTLPGRT
jgi:hypothetical protein